MAASIAGLLWQAVSLIRECRRGSGGLFTTGGVITGSLNGGSSIEVAHGCGKAPTADSLNGGSYIAGAGCDLSYG